MIKIRSEKDYEIKIRDYKGNLISQFKMPERKRDFLKAMISLARLYERAKRHNFLTKDLFIAIKTYAEALYNRKDALHLALKFPVLLKHFKEILNTQPENFEEEIIYGKVREHENAFCSICKVQLVYPAYVVFKKGGVEVKRSAPIGIKCLNSLSEKLIELAEKITGKKHEGERKIDNLTEVEINWEKVRKNTERIKNTISTPEISGKIQLQIF